MEFHGIHVSERRRGLTLLLWSASLIVTLALVVYQRATGPTYPLRGRVEVGGATVSFRLLRSHDTTSDAVLVFDVPDTSVAGELRFRRYKSHDAWTRWPLLRDGEKLVGFVPRQPPAGKVMYQVTLISPSGARVELTKDPVVMRFKGPVPAWALIPHVLLMFGAMLFAVRTALESLVRRPNARKLAWVTVGLIFAGGLILGPVVQWYAFGALWTGWPFGHDLTDNKTAVAFLVWLVALWRERKTARRAWFVAAAIVQLGVYSIPHSVLGSELDYTKATKEVSCIHWSSYGTARACGTS